MDVAVIEIDEDARLVPRAGELGDNGDVGWSADALEAQAFAFTAVHALNKLPVLDDQRRQAADDRRCDRAALVFLADLRAGFFRKAAQNSASNAR